MDATEQRSSEQNDAPDPQPPAYDSRLDALTNAERLRALQRYKVVSTPQRVLNRFTRLASQLYGAPIALLTLLGDERQRFISAIGTDLDGVPAQPSVCASTITSTGVMTVDNLAEDERFADRYYVTGALHLRFYAGAPLTTSDGHPIGTLCVYDTTPRAPDPGAGDALEDLARMAAERLEQDQFSLGKRTGLNQTVIDHLPGIFYVVGPDGCMERWNSRFETLSGYSEAELEGRPAASFFTGSDRDNIEQAIETVFATGSVTVEAQFTTQDGAEVPMLLTGVRSAIQGQTRLVGMGIDISERKQRERQLQAAKEDAERARREAEAARRDAERQRRRAEDANRSKSRFLAGVAHDLKSPVTGIEGFANVLANTLSGQPVEHARSIRRSVQHISDMAHSLTELAQLGTESIERGTAPTEVGALLKTLATDFAPRVEETGVAMHVDLPASDPSASGSSASDPSPSEESSPEGDASGEWGAVWADTHEPSLRRALTNLIENAITYSNAGDTVTLRAAQHVPDANGTLSLGAGQHRVEGRGAADAAACDAWVAITVEDTGPGIDPAFMTRLFEPFARNVSDTEGTGLGLAITKELVETMGGEIRAESEKGNGTRFHVLLPASGTPV